MANHSWIPDLIQGDWVKKGLKSEWVPMWSVPVENNYIDSADLVVLEGPCV